MSYGDKSMLSPQIIAFIYVLALSAVVFAEVVLSPSSPGVIENSSLTFTCTYTGDETVTSFTWKKVKTNESRFANLGLINAECNALIFPMDISLYEYTCLSSKQYTWSIKKVTKQNEGDKYQCVVETLLPKVINSNSVVIYIQVQVTNVTLKDGSTLLAGTLEVTNGVRKTLTCTASESRPTATIIWYIGDDVKQKENVTLSTFTFAPLNSDHNKQVYCKASQTAHPEVFSSRITLYVKELATTPTITDLTTEKLEGDQIRYQCTSSKTRPVAIVTWKLDTLTLTDVQNTEHSHGNDLRSVTSIVTVTVNRTDNDKTIYCKTAIPGQSNLAKAQNTMHVYWPPSSPLISTSNFPFLEGQTGKSIYCSSSDNGNPSATATWFTKYGTHDVADTRILKLPKLTYQVNQSPIKCQLKNLFTQKKGLTLQSEQVPLQVEYSPKLQIIVGEKLSTTITRNEGESLSVTCNASGNPTPTVSWLGQQPGGPTLSFVDIDRMNHGNYTCIATATSTHYPSHNFTTEEKVEVYVNYAPNVTVDISANPTENMTLLMKCKPKGRPADYHFKSFTQKWGNVVIPNKHDISNNGVMEIPNLQLQDSGTYTCHASNGIPDRKHQQLYQSGNSTVIIRVSPKLLLKDNERTFFGRVGLTTLITVPFYSYPPHQVVQFQFENGSTVSNSSKHTVLIIKGYVKAEFYGQEVGLDGYLAQLQINNDDESDFMNYTFLLYNGIGPYKSWTIVHRSTSDVSGAKCDCNQCDNNNIQTIITGIVLGIIIVLLATYAGYLTILMKRKEENKKETISGEPIQLNAPIYTNIANSTCIGGEQQRTDLVEPGDVYTSLQSQSRADKETYDILSVDTPINSI